MSNAGILTTRHLSNLNTPALYEQPNGLIPICAWCGEIYNALGQ